MKAFFGVVISLVLIALSPLQVLAQTTNVTDNLSITASPLPISLSAKPGSSVSTELRIKNDGIKNETLKVGLMKFSAYGEEGKPQLKDRENGDDYFDWVKFSETEFLARPNEWKDLKMTINVPKNAAFGYYYAVTFSRASPGLAKDTTVVVGGTATLVLLEVISPNAKRTMELSEFSISKRTYEFLPAKFTIKVKNTGNVHGIPSGNIYISKGGSQVDVIPVNSTKGNVLPGSGRIFSAEWESGFPVYEEKLSGGNVVLKNGQPTYELSWKINQIKNVRMGKYSAHLTLIYDDGKKDVPIDAVVSFWVIPWRILFVVVGLPLVTVITILYLVISRRRYKNRGYGVRRSQ